MSKLRYSIHRVYYKNTPFGNRLSTEEVECKTRKEAIDLASILTEEEKILGSYIFDNVSHKKLTTEG